ncbi:MAG: dodecin family protein [Bacillota bacterium]
MHVKVIELVGESHSSWKDAVQQAVNEASREVPNITGVEIYNLTADVVNGQLTDYKANVKIAYTTNRHPQVHHAQPHYQQDML